MVWVSIAVVVGILIVTPLILFDVQNLAVVLVDIIVLTLFMLWYLESHRTLRFAVRLSVKSIVRDGRKLAEMEELILSHLISPARPKNKEVT